jgi:hypothetical protein
LQTKPTPPDRPLVTLEKLASASDSAVVSKSIDDNDKRETAALDVREKEAKVSSLEQDGLDKSANRSLREKYASQVYDYLKFYSGAVFLLILASGFRFQGFTLPDSTLLALVGSTATASIGLVGIVVTGLFKSKS